MFALTMYINKAKIIPFYVISEYQIGRFGIQFTVPGTNQFTSVLLRYIHRYSEYIILLEYLLTTVTSTNQSTSDLVHFSIRGLTSFGSWDGLEGGCDGKLRSLSIAPSTFYV